MMEYGQVHHIEYYVNDIAHSNIFWNWFSKELGYSVSSEFEGGISYEHKNGTYLVFVQVEKEFLSTNNNRKGNGLNHIAFQGGSLESLNMLQENLARKGIKILKREGCYLCFEDPNEFAVEIYASNEGQG
jgi:catechol-2,3-dioxygenase